MMTKTHKSYLRRYLNSAKQGRVNYVALTQKVNSKFNTRFSVQQIAGYLGRQIQLG